ncbi:FRG domain-containing protein [Methylobacterium sp. WL122]|nr:FRG domain-containing protein [Methylobacterium sp. WL122]
MHGQWTGFYTGTNDGYVMIDLDPVDNQVQGHAYLTEVGDLPSFLARICLDANVATQTVDVKLTPVHPQSGDIFTAEELLEKYPTYDFPNQATLTVVSTSSKLSITWVTPIGTQGEAEVFPSKASSPSEIVAESDVGDWSAYKAYVFSTQIDRFIYRGQSKPWRLRTSFHRTNRKDLVRLHNIDIPILHKSLISQTPFHYDLSNINHNAAFWHMIQHHGYPTPLMDWTHSPFVAAYFAYKGAVGMRSAGDKVRILMFDSLSWRNTLNQLQYINPPCRHVSMLEALAYDNARSLPQQSLFMVTNIDDVESYVLEQEVRSGKRYLRAFDLDVADRELALAELRMMGVTQGSMFPGLDGICEDIKSRFFGV